MNDKAFNFIKQKQNDIAFNSRNDSKWLLDIIVYDILLFMRYYEVLFGTTGNKVCWNYCSW